MKTTKFLLAGFVTCMMVAFTLPGQAQWVTLARKIRGMHTSQTDVATVILDARTYKVYQAVIDTLSSGKEIKILKREPDTRFVEYSNAMTTISMKVDSLNNGLTQITVAAPHAEDQPKKATDHAVQAIILVCQKMGIQCDIEQP